MNKSAIIIGGGIGGLFTGAILSQEGIKVTVIEKNHNIGGGLQSFQRCGKIFDTGMHVVTGFQPGGAINKLCKYLGILDKLNLKKLDDENAYYVYVDAEHKQYGIANGRKSFVESIVKHFPSESQNVERYIDAITSIVNEFRLLNLDGDEVLPMFSNDFSMPANEFISKYITDAKLQNILAFYNILYAGEKGVTPAYLHSVISLLNIDGAYRFEGGCVQMANALVDVIKTNGGEIVRGDKVVKLDVKGNEIISCHTQSGKTYFADCYISTIHPEAANNLYCNTQIHSRAVAEALEQSENTSSAFIVDIELKEASVKFRNSLGIYYSDYNKAWSCGEQVSDKMLFITQPCKNQGEYASTLRIISPMTWQHVDQWSSTTPSTRPEVYKQWKAIIAEQMIDCISKVIPELRNSIERYYTASPLTIRDAYATTKGAIYGIKRTCSSRLYIQRLSSPKVYNLYFSGQNVFLHGFCGVALTAVATAEAITGKGSVIEKIKKCE